MKLLLNGRGGKVGRVLAPALEAAGHELVDSLEQAEVMVDFTSPQIGLANAEAALAAGVPSVIGTSGLDYGRIDEAARAAGVAAFYAPNFAIGAVLMLRLGRPECGRHEVVPPLSRAAAIAVGEARERAGRSPFDHRAESVAPCVEGQDLVDALPARLRPEIADLGKEREERCRGELPGHVGARRLRAAPRGRP